MKTDDELKQIAKDFKEGKIFSTQHKPLSDNLINMITSVFLPLGFMDQEQHKKLEAESPVVMYEYLDKAGPRSICGMPMFFSFQYLNSEEWNKVVEYHSKLVDAENVATTG